MSDLVATTNLMNYITPDDAPFFIENGTADCNIPPAQNKNLADALSAVIGVENVTYISLEGAGHGGSQFETMGLQGIEKSKISRTCKELDEMVSQFRERKIHTHYPYIWLDAIVLNVRENHRVVKLSLGITIGVDNQGERHILGFELGA